MTWSRCSPCSGSPHLGPRRRWTAPEASSIVGALIDHLARTHTHDHHAAPTGVRGACLDDADIVAWARKHARLLRPGRWTRGSWQTTRGAAERLLEAVAVRPEPDDAGAPPLTPIAGEIRFEGLHVGDPGRPKVLDGLDLTTQSGLPMPWWGSPHHQRLGSKPRLFLTSINWSPTARIRKPCRSA